MRTTSELATRGGKEEDRRVETLEQPPPGPDDLREVPPQGWRGMSPRQFWACVVVGVGVILTAAWVAFTLAIRTTGGGVRSEAISNAKQVGLAMLEFDQDYGSLPSDATVADVMKATGSTLDFYDGTSNAMFRQLIAYGITTEDIFHACHPEGVIYPDGLIHGHDALDTGEVGFSYVVGLTTAGDTDTPVLLTPMRTASYDRFWVDGRFGEQVMRLNLDNSARMVPVRRSDDKAVDEHGRPVLDAAQPYFGGKWPEIRHPKMKP